MSINTDEKFVSVTSFFCECLDQLYGQEAYTIADFKEAAENAFRQKVFINKNEDLDRLLFMVPPIQQKAEQLLTKINEPYARTLTAALQKIVVTREQSGDYWPEGRLNLGILYATTGDFDKARDYMEQARDLFAGKDILAAASASRSP